MSNVFSASGHNKIKDLRLKEILETRLSMNLMASEVNLVVERAWASVKGAGFEIWRSQVQIFHPTAIWICFWLTQVQLLYSIG